MTPTPNHWEEQKIGFINGIVTLMNKHFPEKLDNCPDCSGFSMHICETAFREWCAVFFDKVYQHGRTQARADVLREVMGEMPKEIAPNGFLLTRKPMIGDKESGYNAYRAEMLEIIRKKLAQ